LRSRFGVSQSDTLPATTINAELAEPAEQTGVVLGFCGFCVECRASRHTEATLVISHDDLRAGRRANQAIFFGSSHSRSGTAVAPKRCVAQVLPWRPRGERPKRNSNSNSPSSFLTVGAYAGRAIFRPSARAALTPALARAVGQVVEVGFAGIAPKGELFAGQALYLEWRSDDVLDGFLIPEQDLEFL
jgi:hypothetical protein